MRKIRFYVMEDMPEVLVKIITILNNTPDCEVIGSSGDIQTGFEEIIELSPDVLLLDVLLMGGTAFELIQLLKENHTIVPPSIIMTSEPDFLKASKAVDLLGPSLVKLVDKSLTSWESEFKAIKPSILARLTHLQQEDTELKFQTVNAVDELLVRSSHITYRIVMGEVLFLNAEQKETTFTTRDGKNIQVKKSLRELIQKLPPYFCQISRDTAINLRHLDHINHVNNALFLTGSKKAFYIGDQFRDKLKSALDV